MNIWKGTALALAGVLVVVVGRGSVRETVACEGAAPPSPEEQTQIRLTTALSLLDQAEREIKAAPTLKATLRADAVAQIALAKSGVTKGLAAEPVQEPPRPRPRPLPRPRPRVSEPRVADPGKTVSL